MTDLDIEAIRQRNARRRPARSPAVGDTMTFTGTNSDDHETVTAVLTQIKNTHNFGVIYRVEQHVRFADFQITDEHDKPLAQEDIREATLFTSQEVHLYATDADPEIDEPLVDGNVEKTYAKHGDLYGHVSFDLYREDWWSITLADPSARDDITALLAEVDDLRAKLLAT